MANPIKLQRGTQITFGSEVGDDEAWSTENIADGAGQLSDVRAFPAAPAESLFNIQIFLQHQSGLTLKAASNFYINRCGHAATEAHSPIGSFDDGAITSEDLLSGCDHFDSVIVRVATADLEFAFSGDYPISDRHWGLAGFNNGGSAWTNAAAEIKGIVTPLFDEIQD